MATVTANQETALARVESITAVELFTPGKIDPLIDRIKEEVREQAAALDISTEANRKKLASLAYKVGRSKTFIDGQRKALVTDEKKRLAAIDTEGRRIWNELEALQEEVRRPLTDWENAEHERIAAHEEALASIAESANYGTSESVADLELRLEQLDSYLARDWQEFKSRAIRLVEEEKARTVALIAKARQREEEQAELARLREEAAERARKDREEAIANHAREEAERKAREQAESTARAAEEERKRIEREKTAAEARAKAAEDARIAAEEKAARDAKQAAERAERARVEAEQRAERDRVAAVEAERKRVAEQQRLAREEAEKRERNRRHRTRINGEACEGLRALGLSAEQAEAVIAGIAQGGVPHVTITY